jgi:hypothetical protein
MKNKIAITSAFLAVSSFSFAEIALTENISVEGFVDMSYSQGSADADQGAADFNESTNSYALDQVEISWLFDFSPVTAQIDLEYEEGQFGGTNVEQAFITYDLSGPGAITAGRFASMLGFEAFEPTGLYQFSTAYSASGSLADLANNNFENSTRINANDFEEAKAGPVGDFRGVTSVDFLPGYNQGVKYTYTTETSFYGISLLDGDEDGSRLGGDNDNFDAGSGYAIEAAAAFDLGNGLNWFLGLRIEDNDPERPSGFGDFNDTQENLEIINTYLTYETGAWTFAGEVVLGEQDNVGDNSDVEGTLALVMANYAYSDVASVTARFSMGDQETDVAPSQQEDIEFTKLSLAHLYAFSDNLALCAEVSFTEGEVDPVGNNNSIDFESTDVAVELLFTF